MQEQRKLHRQASVVRKLSEPWGYKFVYGPRGARAGHGVEIGFLQGCNALLRCAREQRKLYQQASVGRAAREQAMG